MAEEGYLTLFTLQRQVVLELLKGKQTYYVQKRFIREKYGESAGVFLEVYRWYVTQAALLLAKPPQAESAVWAFADAVHATPGAGGCLLTLRVPRTEVLLFDVRDWSRILNALPLGTKDVRQAYEQNLAKQGINRPEDVLTTPFYPLQKAALLASWSNLFSGADATDAPCIQRQYVQAGLWKIDPAWVLVGE